MKDSTLLKISLIWSTIGIFLLLFISEYTEPPKVKINNLEENLGKKVTIEGKVLSFNSKQKVTFIEVEDNTGKINVITFDKINTIRKNTKVKITGKVELYKGNLELVANKIIC